MLMSYKNLHDCLPPQGARSAMWRKFGMGVLLGCQLAITASCAPDVANDQALPTEAVEQQILQQEQSPITVADYNVNKDVDAAVTVDELQHAFTQFDLVAVQELDSRKKQNLIKATTPLCAEIYCDTDGFVADGKDGATSIFWNNVRFDMVPDELTGAFTLHETQYVTNANGTESKLLKKVMTVVRLHDELNDDDLYVVNIHLPYDIEMGNMPAKDEKERLELYEKDMAIIMAKIKALQAMGIDIVLVGDLNWHEGADCPQSPEVRFKALGFESVYDDSVINISPDINHTHIDINNGKTEKRLIDYILQWSANGKKKIEERAIIARLASDHNMVVAKLSR